MHNSGWICHLVHTVLYFRIYTTARSIMRVSVNYMALAVTHCLWDVTYSSKCQVSVLAFFENKAKHTLQDIVKCNTKKLQIRWKGTWSRTRANTSILVGRRPSRKGWGNNHGNIYVSGRREECGCCIIHVSWNTTHWHKDLQLSPLVALCCRPYQEKPIVFLFSFYNPQSHFLLHAHGFLSAYRLAWYSAMSEIRSVLFCIALL